MAKRFLILAVGIVFVAPASGSSVLLAGEDRAPERVLEDECCNVKYDQLHTGTQDHDYLDFLAAWLDYHNSTDRLTLTVNVSDATRLENPSHDFLVGCLVNADTWVDDVQTGSVTWDWVLNPLLGGGVQWLHSASWQAEDDASAQFEQRNISLAHEFTANLETPGTFSWVIDRAPVAQRADEFRVFSALCYEWYRPGGQPPLPVFYRPLYENRNDAVASTEYRLPQPARVEGFDEDEASPSPIEPTQRSREATPSPGAWLAILGLLIGVIGATALPRFR